MTADETSRNTQAYVYMSRNSGFLCMQLESMHHNTSSSAIDRGVYPPTAVAQLTPNF